MTLARTVESEMLALYSFHWQSLQLPLRRPPNVASQPLTVKCDNADDETNAQDHDNERVDLEAGALVGVELQHSGAAATGTSGASARRAGIGDFVGAVGSGAATDGSGRSSRRFGRGGACGCAAGGGSDGGVGRLKKRLLVTIRIGFHVLNGWSCAGMRY